MMFEYFISAVIIFLIIIFVFYSVMQNVTPAEMTEIIIGPVFFPQRRYDNIPLMNNDDIIQELAEINSRKAKKKDPPIIATDLRSAKDKEKYFQSLEAHASDSQNVHERQITQSLTKKYQRMLELNPNFMTSFENEFNGFGTEELQKAKVEETIRQVKSAAKGIYNDEKLTKINLMLQEIEKANCVSSYSTDGAPIREDWILTLVWERIHHPDNKNNTEKLEEIFLDQLIDGVVKYSLTVDPLFNHMFQFLQFIPSSDPEFITVCINGRVGRMISSLSILDADPILAEPEKDEKELANVAYLKASKILQNALAEQKMSDLYQKEIHTEQERELLDKFEKEVRDKIAEELTKDFQSLLPVKNLQEIIHKAQLGV